LLRVEPSGFFRAVGIRIFLRFDGANFEQLR
jgi:hypothetical protein